FQAFVADDTLEVSNHHGVRVRTRDRTDDVERIFNVGDPIAHGLVQGVLERTRTRIHGYHRSTQQLHAIDIGGLAADVFATHIDDALHAIAGGNRSRCNAVLTGARLGDDARLAQPARQQDLT